MPGHHISSWHGIVSALWVSLIHHAIIPCNDTNPSLIFNDKLEPWLSSHNSMARLTITPALVTAINAIHDCHPDHPISDGEVDSTLGSPRVGDPITHTQVLAISKSLRRHIGLSPSAPSHLDELLKGSKIYHEPPEPKAEPVRLKVAACLLYCLRFGRLQNTKSLCLVFVTRRRLGHMNE